MPPNHWNHPQQAQEAMERQRMSEHEQNTQRPTCSKCGKEMVFNVPRMGPAGGYVHAGTGLLLCADEEQERIAGIVNFQDRVIALYTDRQRLDWLESGRHADKLHTDHSGGFFFEDFEMETKPTIRAAIDEAMRNGKYAT